MTMVLRKETAFPIWRAMDRRWKRNVVSLVSSVMVVMRLPISYVSFCGHVVPCTSCLHDNWVEDASTGQFGILGLGRGTETELYQRHSC